MGAQKKLYGNVDVIHF